MDQFIEILKGGKLFRTIRVEPNCWTYFDLRQGEVTFYQENYRACEKAKLPWKTGPCSLRAWFNYSEEPFTYNNFGEPQYMASTMLLQEMDENGIPKKSLSSLADFEPQVPPTASVKHAEYECKVHEEVTKMYRMIHDAQKNLFQNLAEEQELKEALVENENVVSLHPRRGMTECEGGGYRPTSQEHVDTFLALIKNKKEDDDG